MRLSSSRYKRNGNYNIYSDLAKIKNAISNTASDVQEQTMDVLKDKSTKVKDTIVDYTYEKPFKSLGFALLAGIILGFLFRK